MFQSLDCTHNVEGKKKNSFACYFRYFWMHPQHTDVVSCIVSIFFLAFCVVERIPFAIFTRSLSLSLSLARSHTINSIQITFGSREKCAQLFYFKRFDRCVKPKKKQQQQQQRQKRWSKRIRSLSCMMMSKWKEFNVGYRLMPNLS